MLTTKHGNGDERSFIRVRRVYLPDFHSHTLKKNLLHQEAHTNPFLSVSSSLVHFTLERRRSSAVRRSKTILVFNLMKQKADRLQVHCMKLETQMFLFPQRRIQAASIDLSIYVQIFSTCTLFSGTSFNLCRLSLAGWCGVQL